MKQLLKHFITINNKKYFYNLKVRGKTTFVNCPEANLAQAFKNEDVPALLNDLPNLILAEKKYRKNHDKVIRFRISLEDKILIEKKALQKGYSSVSSFLRDLAIGKSLPA